MSQPLSAAVDLIVLGGMILTLNEANDIHQDGALAIRKDTIVAVGPRPEILARFSAATVLDYAADIILPGLINAHTHAAMTCFRGLADDLPLEVWLNDYIFPAERQISRDLVYWGTKLAIAEMLLSGTTTFCDMYLFADAVAQAAREAGMRAVVGEVLYDFPSANYGPKDNGLRFTEELIQTWRHDPLIRVAVQPHAVYTCSPDLLKRCGELAERHDTRLIIHLSETRQEVADCQQHYGASPVEHLFNLGLLNTRLVADHGVALSHHDQDLLAAQGVSVVHCPESNMKLASGVAPIVSLLAKGVNVALGTDGCASNNNLDLFQEMDTAAKLHKVYHLDPTVMSASTVLHLTTVSGARALNLHDRIGSLEPGKQADLIVIDCDRPHLTPMYQPYSQLVYAAMGADVRTVVIAGRPVVQDRRLLTLDVEEAMAKVREYARQIKAKVEPR
ncbi:amidohydrolase family protein [Desulfobacca acetoxidans]|uniref:5-methylthioadenosine/S-adenosylhomocysteine deaminase n=1 Tax=Desulfobacca acetoxidans (strain ATCC 700848 / DSM 11109 / ASRB2) TaxID=880072 RepID=F2NER5_DESAR|nr:amidohydrolase [Desulfobacca acetoxidans]AEB08255.1 5-methylthioadenosine/S-adenosylhomocysteine deaminase [Desulfobacca acetoxidans DSM 11109]